MPVECEGANRGPTPAPVALRERFRRGLDVRPTAGLAPGFVQANLVILPREAAFDFLLFCQRNPKACPLLEVVEAGSAEPRRMARGADLRTDVPKYRVYRAGQLVSEPIDIRSEWRGDLVSFLLGCSFTFESALVEAGVPVRHLERCSNVPMYITSIATDPAGLFHGPMVVSMRPIPAGQIVRAVQVTSRFPAVHGGPVHIGDPGAIGIDAIERPDLGDPVEIRPGEVPVFWACGVTPQAVAMASKPPLMITHAPGHMFITDRRDSDYAVI
ncbi:MAG TPA: putative hydro-lyase [Vicinamibacterales bacterium]|nr:putative hydro-lyase [Vicinamibacterales bacterium]